MIEIDGSKKSGSGTILRLSVALSAIIGDPLHIYNIRKKRGQPGLRPQHLEAVLTAARLCNAEVKGASVGSQEIWFYPREISGGDVGTDVRHSPTINYLKYILLPILKRMGLEASIKVHKYGYYPKGMGEVTLKTQPCRDLKPIRLEKFGNIKEIGGISVCTFLADRKVALRQAKEAERLLKLQGYDPKIRVLNDFSNPIQKGSSLVLWARTDAGVLLGSDAIGELRKPSEAVAREAVKNLLDEIESKATADMHLADMLIPYVALAEGESTFSMRLITDHIESNIWLVNEILGVSFEVRKQDGLVSLTKK